MSKTISQFTLITNLDTRGYRMVVEDSNGLYKSIDPENACGGLVRVVMELTQGQLQSGNTTPIELLEAQGASTLIDPISVCVTYQHNGTNYGGATYLRVHNSGDVNYMKRSSGLLVQSAVSRRERLMEDVSADANFAMAGNSALMISLDANATGNGGSMFISALLRVVRFA